MKPSKAKYEVKIVAKRGLLFQRPLYLGRVINSASKVTPETVAGLMNMEMDCSM